MRAGWGLRCQQAARFCQAGWQCGAAPAPGAHVHNVRENPPLPPPRHAARERIIGWYHTGPRLREADLDMHQLLANYCENPILVISEVQVRAGALTHSAGALWAGSGHACPLAEWQDWNEPLEG